MTKTTQTKFGKEGNCLSACVASLLDEPIDNIPDFADEIDWFESLYKYCLIHNIGLIHINATSPLICLLSNLFCILIYEVKGFEKIESHAVVGKCIRLDNLPDGTWRWETDIYFDPNPNHVNLGKMTDIIILVKP